jgi:hypothetical protein
MLHFFSVRIIRCVILFMVISALILAIIQLHKKVHHKPLSRLWQDSHTPMYAAFFHRFAPPLQRDDTSILEGCGVPLALEPNLRF